MSVFNIMRNAVAAALGIGIFVWPCDGDAAKMTNDDRWVGKIASRRRRNSSPALPDAEKPVSTDTHRVLLPLISSARNAKDLSEENREILVDALTLIARTPRGKWLLSNVSPEIRFVETPEDASENGFFSHGNLSLGIKKKYFTAVSKAKTPTDRKLRLYRLIITLAHELVHAAQNYRSICLTGEVSTSDCVIMLKLRELQAHFEERLIKGQVLELPDFRVLREKRPHLYSDNIVMRMRDEKMREGLSPKAAERAVRTEYMKALWRGRPSDPVRIGEELFFFPRAETWNNVYNTHAFKQILGGRPNYYRDRGKSVDGELRRAVSFMEADISPAFFRNEKEFTFAHGRLTSYLEGIKNREMDYLTAGHMIKTYFDGRLKSVYLAVTHAENGSFTDYWYGTKRRRATYTIEAKKPVGVYREYDYSSGRQVAEIPFSNGDANGIGWVVEDGKKVKYYFRQGWCYGPDEEIKISPNRDADFWRGRYLEKQRSAKK